MQAHQSVLRDVLEQRWAPREDGIGCCRRVEGTILKLVESLVDGSLQGGEPDLSREQGRIRARLLELVRRKHRAQVVAKIISELGGIATIHRRDDTRHVILGLLER